MTKFILTLALLVPGKAMGEVIMHSQREIFEHFQEAGFTGVVGVRVAGESVAQAFGAEAGRPISVTDHFLIGSVTKQFTAAAILKLYERGKLTLSDRLSKFLPEFRNSEVTLHHLLAQTSGVREVTASPVFALLKMKRFVSLAPLVRLIATLSADFPPGSKWAYSNSNYFLLARVIEVVSGENWWDFVKRELVAAAGMKDTDYSQDRGQRLVAGHEFDRDYAHVALQEVAYFERGWANGAGGIESTVRDLESWNEALFGGRILGRETLALMTSPHGKASESESYGYGLFIARDTATGETYFYHPGGIPGYIAYNAYFPQRKMSVVSVANYASTESVDFAAALASLAIKKEAAVRVYIDDPSIPRFSLAPFEGRFESVRGSAADIKISHENGALYAGMAGQPDHRLVIRGKGVFYDRSLGLELRFSEGSTDEFEIVTPENKLRFRRVQDSLGLFSALDSLLRGHLWF